MVLEVRGRLLPVTWIRAIVFLGLLAAAIVLAQVASDHDWPDWVTAAGVPAITLLMGLSLQTSPKPPNFGNQAASALANAYNASAAITEEVGNIGTVRARLNEVDGVPEHIDSGLAFVQTNLQKANKLVAQSVGPWQEVEPKAVELARVQNRAGHELLAEMSRDEGASDE